MRTNRALWFFVGLFVLGSTLISFGGLKDSEMAVNGTPPSPTPDSQDTRDLSKYGMVDYSAPISNQSPSRFLVNKRYDNQAWVYPVINNPRTGGVGRITDALPPPLFPVDESSMIVTGEVTSVKAFLSNDRGSVYTEFTVCIEQVLKNGTDKAAPKNLTIDRAGGVVIYSTGQRVLYQDSDRELPKPGDKYLFFLAKNDQSPNYEVLTSYVFDGNNVRQMEIGRPFDEFKDLTKSSFVDQVRNKITESRRSQ